MQWQRVFLKIAVVYLVAGVWMGIVSWVSHSSSSTRRCTLTSTCSDGRRSDWIGLIYHVHPKAAQTRLAQLHFWLHNVGLPIFMVSLFLQLSGHAEARPGIAAGAIITLAGIMMFAINLLAGDRLPAARPVVRRQVAPLMTMSRCHARGRHTDAPSQRAPGGSCCGAADIDRQACRDLRASRNVAIASARALRCSFSRGRHERRRDEIMAALSPGKQ